MAIGRLFIANRGEIALRVARAAQALNIESVLGVSEADKDSAAAAISRARNLSPSASMMPGWGPTKIMP